MNLSQHWAAYLINKPYKKLAAGPDEFDCLGLMEYVFRTHKNIELPVTGIRLGEVGNDSAIRDAAASSGLRPVMGMAQADDLMLMQNAEGPHVGMVIWANSKFNLLHSVDGIGVCLSRLTDLTFMGYKNFRSWRIV